MYIKNIFHWMLICIFVFMSSFMNWSSIQRKKRAGNNNIFLLFILMLYLHHCISRGPCMIWQDRFHNHICIRVLYCVFCQIFLIWLFVTVNSHGYISSLKVNKWLNFQKLPDKISWTLSKHCWIIYCLYIFQIKKTNFNIF